MVQLLLDKRANANALTFSTRKPGGYCALGSLVENKAQESRWDDIYTIAKLLFHQMEMEKFAVRTTTGRTLWHLLASQGKDRLLKLLLDWFDTKFGHRELAKQLNTLTSDDGRTGKSVLDDAIFNKSCFVLVAKKGGVNVHPRVTNLGEFVWPGHHLHRDTYRQ